MKILQLQGYTKLVKLYTDELIYEKKDNKSSQVYPLIIKNNGCLLKDF